MVSQPTESRLEVTLLPLIISIKPELLDNDELQVIPNQEPETSSSRCCHSGDHKVATRTIFILMTRGVIYAPGVVNYALRERL